MNTLSVLFPLMALICLQGGRCTEEEDRINMIYAKCREETQIEDGEIDTFRRMELPTTTKGQCMMGCLMREASIIIDGRFYKDGALRVAERYYLEKPYEMEKARMVIDICEKRIENETEECEIAGKLASCVIEEAQISFFLLLLYTQWALIMGLLVFFRKHNWSDVHSAGIKSTWWKRYRKVFYPQADIFVPFPKA